MIYLELMLEFFKIGLFSFGGGYATIPFLYNISEVYGWYTIKELTQIIAVASITPGPVGINAATYAGLKSAGILGSLCATVFEVIPSLIFVIFISKLLRKFSENFYIKSLIETLKPISCALLLAVVLGMIKSEIHELSAVVLLAILLLMSWKSKKDPIFYILISAFAGILIKTCLPNILSI